MARKTVPTNRTRKLTKLFIGRSIVRCFELIITIQNESSQANLSRAHAESRVYPHLKPATTGPANLIATIFASTVSADSSPVEAEGYSRRSGSNPPQHRRRVQAPAAECPREPRTGFAAKSSSEVIAPRVCRMLLNCKAPGPQVCGAAEPVCIKALKSALSALSVPALRRALPGVGGNLEQGTTAFLAVALLQRSAQIVR